MEGGRKVGVREDEGKEIWGGVKPRGQKGWSGGANDVEKRRGGKSKVGGKDQEKPWGGVGWWNPGPMCLGRSKRKRKPALMHTKKKRPKPRVKKRG